MIINAHEHPSDQAVRNQRELGIDMSILLPVGEAAQARAIEMATAEPDRWVPFIWVGYEDQWGSAAETVKRYAEEHDCRGVKFQALLQHGFPDDRRLYPMYEYCQTNGLPVLWHCGTVGFRAEFGRPDKARYANSAVGIDMVAADFPELRQIIGHVGGNFTCEACVIAGKHEHVYMDTAYLTWMGPRMFPAATPEALIEHAVQVAGVDRVMYACEGVSPDAVRRTSLTDEEKTAVLGGNAARLLGLTV